MSDDLKTQVLELAAIAKECPDNLQERCFELLLMDLLATRSGTKTTSTKSSSADNKEEFVEDPADALESDDESSGQQDVKLSDLHMKARKFLEKQALTISEVNALFYKEDNELKPLYEDLKTTRMAEGQVRIALIQAFRASMKTGEFETNLEAVRAECVTRKCYDQSNFTSNFKKNASLFDGLEKFDKGTKLRLSEDGRKELAKVLRDLSK